MSLSTLNSEQLTQLIRLVKEKEILEGKLQQVIVAIDQLDNGNTTTLRRSGLSKNKSAATNGKTGKSERLKEGILTALKAAGPEGITVTELGEKLNMNTTNVFSWFYSTGKKISGLKKIGKAKYALSA